MSDTGAILREAEAGRNGYGVVAGPKEGDYLPQGVVKEIDEGNFRFENQKVLLTYKGHLDKAGLKAFFDYLAPSKKCKDVMIAHETGDTSCPYEHTHAYVDFGVAKKSRSCRFLDYANVHPHIQPVITRNTEPVIRYLCKEDPAHAELKAKLDKGKQPVADVVWGATNIQEALRNVKKVSDVTGTIALWGYKEKPVKVMPKTDLRAPWQRQLWEELDAPTWDHRSICWVTERTGGVGKSHFCQTYKLNNLKDVLLLTNLGGQGDTATIIDGAIESGWTQRVLIIDLPRGASDYKIYPSLEAVMNGFMNTTKWRGKEQLFERPRVVVFANWLPDFRQMSLDRWNLLEIANASVLSIVPNPHRLARLARERLLAERPIDWDAPAPPKEEGTISIDAMMQELSIAQNGFTGRMQDML